MTLKMCTSSSEVDIWSLGSVPFHPFFEFVKFCRFGSLDSFTWRFRVLNWGRGVMMLPLLRSPSFSVVWITCSKVNSLPLIQFEGSNSSKNPGHVNNSANNCACLAYRSVFCGRRSGTNYQNRLQIVCSVSYGMDFSLFSNGITFTSNVNPRKAPYNFPRYFGIMSKILGMG